jgi:nitrilase
MTRIAVVQAGSVLFDTPATLAKLERLAAEAAASGAQLAVFPEAFVGGYPKFMGFGATLGTRSDEGRDQFRAYFDCAIPVPGPETDRIAAAAAAHGLHLVVGVIERGGSTLYCTALTFGPDGALLAKHRKLMPTAIERILWGQGDGSTMQVAETAIGRVGAAICWENYMPLYRTHLYAQGVEIWCAPTVDDRDPWPATMRFIALEGRCFVASAVQYLDSAMLPPGYPAEVQRDPLIRGGSLIVGPLGEVLAGPEYGRECILTAEIDLGALPRARFDFDPVGHYARPDIFHLSVNTTARNV